MPSLVSCPRESLAAGRMRSGGGERRRPCGVLNGRWRWHVFGHELCARVMAWLLPKRTPWRYLPVHRICASPAGMRPALNNG